MRRLISWNLASAIALALCAGAAGTPVHAIDKAATNSETRLYIVTFSEPGVMHYEGDIPSFAATTPETFKQSPHSVHYDVKRPEVVGYRNYLHDLQNRHISEIKTLVGHELTPRHAYDLTRSGVAVELTKAEAADVARLNGVKSVEIDRSYKLDTFRSPSFIGAPSVWNGSATSDGEANLGQGVTIGMIDSGINSNHPSFDNNWPVVSDPVNYCGMRNLLYIVPIPPKVLSAVDCSLGSPCGNPALLVDRLLGANTEDNLGHGSHTASTAAGSVVTVANTEVYPDFAVPSFPIAGLDQMSGIAPCAYLRVYKVCNGSSCPGADVLAAQEAAIADAVDVINFSMDGGYEPWSATDIDNTFLEAFRAGIIVVAAAGNTVPQQTPSDPDPWLQPAGYVAHRGPWLLTVAASSHDEVPDMAGDVLASFSLRGPNISHPVLWNCCAPEDTYYYPAYTGFDVTKPDITAPGIHIYAASYSTSVADPVDPFDITPEYAYLSGTSMSTPHLAGAAALVLGAHSGDAVPWSPAEVMSALRMTAFTGGTEEDGVTPWTPDDVGNGRVDLTKAARAGLVMDETYANFLAANPATGGDPKTLNLPAVRNSSCNAICTWTRTVRNTADYPATWYVATIYYALANIGGTRTSVAQIEVSPSLFELAARGSSGDTQVLTITATISSPPSSTPGPLGFGSIVLSSAAPPGGSLTTLPIAPPGERITVAVQSVADPIMADGFEMP